MMQFFRAPGCINLIGEPPGQLLSVALDLGCTVSMRPNGAGRLRLHSINYQDTRSWSLQEVREAASSKDWTDGVIGVAHELERVGYETPDVDLEFESDLPARIGLGDSAAIEVATALALLGSRKMEPLHIARLCHRAATEFAGASSSITDPFTSLLGVENSALLIDSRNETRRTVRLPGGVVWMLVNSMIKPAGIAQDENERVLKFADAASRNDVIGMGRLMSESKPSCQELDFLVATALSVPGVLGARGTGSCTVNLLTPQAEPAFRDRLPSAYRNEFARDLEIYKFNPSGGARRIS